MFKFAIKNLLTRTAKFLMTTVAIIVATLIIIFKHIYIELKINRET